MWLSKKAWAVIEWIQQQMIRNEREYIERKKLNDERWTAIEKGLDKLMQSHAALTEQTHTDLTAADKGFIRLVQDLSMALGPNGILGKKLDVVSGQLVRIEKALARKKGK